MSERWGQVINNSNFKTVLSIQKAGTNMQSYTGKSLTDNI